MAAVVYFHPSRRLFRRPVSLFLLPFLLFRQTQDGNDESAPNHY
ncbi:hypothetical protein NEIELOOT_01268 [Neisseria elongata subsp. glycolytica ATCC 29315]|uniref:Uncharacterized protein n=1 Tax=Neisseria elongata subsp. glycolytica ATCC 29315 TaxID=546263 RepID=D4DQD1_NEIEG|nr:hypothetical protein NEIELOOT_01268 [Neisseria elongata subsp. glycolytica ATCC 29315]